MHRVTVALAVLVALASASAQAQEQRNQFKTALSVVGGLSVGSSGPGGLDGRGLGAGHFGFERGGGSSGFAVGGGLAHDLTPRLTLEATGLYLDRHAGAWSADAGLRLNLKPSSESLVPYFAVSGGAYGQSTETFLADVNLPDGRRRPGQPGRGDGGLPFDVTTRSSHRTDAMMTMGGGAVFSAGSHVFVRPDARAQVVFSGDSRVLGLFTLNFGYRF
jgi:hypothetical protein